MKAVFTLSFIPAEKAAQYNKSQQEKKNTVTHHHNILC